MLFSADVFAQEVEYTRWKPDKDTLPRLPYIEIKNSDIATLTEEQLDTIANSKITHFLVKRIDGSDFEMIYPYLPNGLLVLEMPNSRFEEWPRQLSLPRGLIRVDFSKAETSYIPEEFCALNNLSQLILWGSNVGKLPTCLQNIPSLKRIDLIGIQFNVEEHDAMQEIFEDQGILLSPPCNCDFQNTD